MQRKKIINRNRLDDEPGETNKIFNNELFADESYSYRNICFSGIRQLRSPGAIENTLSAMQLVSRSLNEINSIILI